MGQTPPYKGLPFLSYNFATKFIAFITLVESIFSCIKFGFQCKLVIQIRQAFGNFLCLFYVKCGILKREEKLCNIFYVYWVDLSITSLSCCCKCSFSFPWDLRGVLEICWAFSHLFDTHSWSSIALKTNSDLYKSHWKTANISKWSRYQYW